MTLIGQ
jgi:hypothetical protein